MPARGERKIPTATSGRHDTAPERRHAQHRVQAEPATGDVADVEYETAEHHEEREHVTDAGQDAIAEFLRTQARDADHAPDVQLQRDVHQYRGQDRERESRAELRGELCRLRDETRADRARGHQEHRAEDRAARRGAWCFVVHQPPGFEPVDSAMQASHASRRLTRGADRVRNAR